MRLTGISMKATFDKKGKTALLPKLIYIIAIHFVIKIGDNTFDVFNDLSWRGTVFSIYFISYWLLIWYLVEYISSWLVHRKKVQIKPGFLLPIIHFLVAVAAGFICNYLYRIGDIAIYENWETYETVTIFNPELTLSLATFYMMVFTYHVYHSYQLQRADQKIRLQKMNEEMAKAQFEGLKAQLEPHFLFNSLSVLSSLIDMNPKLAIENTVKLSKILRYVVSENKDP